MAPPKRKAQQPSKKKKALGLVMRKKAVLAERTRINLLLDEKALAGRKAVMEMLGLKEDTSGQEKLTPLRGKKGYVHGATETAYRIHLGSLRFFCKLTGNYEDLLILEPNAPENCPSVKASTVEMFMRYKCGQKGSPLKVSPTGEALQMDVFGGGDEPQGTC